jgi:paraquat-inducible protein B
VSRRANPTLVGAFVVGALALGVVGVAVFGSGRLFRETYPFVCYFEGGVHGLDPGAPVKFKGVEVGSVKRIMLRFEQTPSEVRIPVILEFDADKLTRAGMDPSFGPEGIQVAVEQGLRARLESESLVTGLLFVNLDFYPETPKHLVGTGDIPEIPTLPTTFEQATLAVKEILDRLAQVDLEGLVESATEALRGIRDLAASREARGALASLDATLASLERLSDALERTAVPLGESVRETSDRTQALAAELERTLQVARELIEPGSPVSHQLTATLQDVSSAARALRALAETLERDPSALVRGRAVDSGRR